jgi:hypothetical protein
MSDHFDSPRAVADQGHEASGRPCGDRRGRGIPGLAARQLYDGSDRGRRRRPNRDLATTWTC